MSNKIIKYIIEIEKSKEEGLKKMKKNMGITLIALVITVIVLLILAGISIAMLTANNRNFIKSDYSKSRNNNGTSI